MSESKKKAFVIMPFSGPINGYYEKIYKAALERAKYSVTRADDMFKTGGIMRDIAVSIREADLILCEMTGRNPNVLYELGMAHANGKRVILLAQKAKDIPFDVRHLRTILYDPAQAGWEAKLRDAIRKTAENSDDPVDPLGLGFETPKAVAEEPIDIKQRLDEILNEIRSVPKAEEREDWKNAYSYLSWRYGWGYDDLLVSGVIDEHGAITIERQVTVTARRQLAKLEQSLHVRPPNLGQPLPTLSDKDLRIRSRTPGTTVNAGRIYPLESGWVVEVLFEPPVPPGSTVTFVLTEFLSEDTYAIDYSEEKLLAADIKHQWFGWRIDRPTLSFSARVQMPPGYKPRGYEHRAFVPPMPKDIDNARRHSDEEERLKTVLERAAISGGAGDRYTLELFVDLPILGILYMVRWDPLTRAREEIR